jgi:hypothetical protein
MSACEAFSESGSCVSRLENGCDAKCCVFMEPQDIRWYVGNDSRVFELLTAVLRIQPTKLLIGDDWTHRVCGHATKRERVAFSDVCTLFMWWKSIGDPNVWQFWNLGNVALNGGGIVVVGHHSLSRCRERENSSPEGGPHAARERALSPAVVTGCRTTCALLPIYASAREGFELNACPAGHAVRSWPPSPGLARPSCTSRPPADRLNPTAVRIRLPRPPPQTPWRCMTLFPCQSFPVVAPPLSTGHREAYLHFRVQNTFHTETLSFPSPLHHCVFSPSLIASPFLSLGSHDYFPFPTHTVSHPSDLFAVFPIRPHVPGQWPATPSRLS